MVNPDKIFGRLSNRMFQMAALYAYCRDNNYPIFVQDEKYFAKYKDEIKKWFGEGIKPNSSNRVAVHYRCGKNPINPSEPAYNENPFYENLSHHLHEDMSDNYYVQAMAMFPDDEFTIFTDDTEKCAAFFNKLSENKQIDNHKVVIYKGLNDWEDLNHMANAKHIIGANSSFSWWAAWLGDYPGRKIIFPKKWFSNSEDEKFIGIPPEWIRI